MMATYLFVMLLDGPPFKIFLALFWRATLQECQGFTVDAFYSSFLLGSLEGKKPKSFLNKEQRFDVFFDLVIY